VNVRSSPHDEHLRHLEEEKQSLALQVSVLSDQVEAQAEKIRDMDMCLEDYRRRVMDASNVLQQGPISFLNETVDDTPSHSLYLT
ncbi:liprin-beta-1, partial [Biomphalaria glabrata]